MSLKYLGAVLIAAACCTAGTSYVSSVRKHIRALESLCAALELTAGELRTRAAPIPEVCALLAKRSDGAAVKFFSRLTEGLEELGERTFSAIWSKAVEDELTCLSPEEQSELKGLGNILGRYELAQQESVLAACVLALRAGLSRAKQSYPGQRKLGLGLSAAAAALIVVILL